MSLKKSSLIILFSLLFFFVASTITSVGLIIKSNTSLDNVNKEIQVVLSIIDPINHSRTLRVRVMEYVKMVEAGDATDLSAKLASVKEALTKADSAFSAFMASPRLPDEAPLVTAYREAWQNYRNGDWRLSSPLPPLTMCRGSTLLFPWCLNSIANMKLCSIRFSPFTRSTPKR